MEACGLNPDLVMHGLLSRKSGKSCERMMVVYMAFLRGINVGGHNILKMQDIRQKFNNLGFENVSSYKASGNILFRSDTNPIDVAASIKNELRILSGREIEVFLRTSSQLNEILNLEPFEEVDSDIVKLYVTFIPNASERQIGLPLLSAKKDIEIILVRDGAVFSKAYERKGRFGVPNKFVENEFQVVATTRNWNTIIGLGKVINQ
jgi:uncharacterized protein (DUF1697 family)